MRRGIVRKPVSRKCGCGMECEEIGEGLTSELVDSVDCDDEWLLLMY